MTTNEPRTDGILAAFLREPMMQTLQVTVESVEHGRATIRMACAEKFEQSVGFLHPGATTTLADAACSLAARSIAENDQPYTIELQISHLSPSTGTSFLAVAEVTGTHGPLTYCTARVTAPGPGGQIRHIAAAEATVALLPVRD